MLVNNWIIQGIGFIGLGFLVLAFQQNNRKKILFLILAGQIIFLGHFILLGAWTAVAMNIVGAVRTLIFSYKEQNKWANKPYWPFFFIACFIVFGALTWQGWYSILPIIAMSIETIGLWMKNPKFIRIINIFPHPPWFTYNLIIGSWPGIATEILIFGSVLVGIWRFDVNKETKK
ncbi:MAG: YgjV family protein [Bacteroidetes bacterium]|nr:YgjV family protein [Bacteroidota bacterium]MBT7094147.1 YgjV family protein [Bacteroidota bacterium]MBT7463889.1 YgjV family protein [Bacteroidota bacterium]